MCVRICDKSLRQNLNQLMREHQLVSCNVKFEIVYISSLSKSIACTKQVSYRSDLSQQQCRRGDLSPRCVAAICRIVCLSLYRHRKDCIIQKLLKHELLLIFNIFKSKEITYLFIRVFSN